ncbi:MAG TPA: acetyl-CoA carboxylase carboxyltransferase subunit alpha [Methylomirabilota bacterium]|jgi:acetyl-CoA carboxylase carboxyl transferase subunit alpha|nr:acetyl-CoA carboxylase carboxyltransferase subunit alpha [Methylomirabilota bacterium]
MPTTYLDFEKTLAELDKRLEMLRRLSVRSDEEQQALTSLEEQCRQHEAEIYGALSPWQRVQLSRHTDRPYTLDYIEQLCSEFVELHGDRTFADDPAIVGGLARFRGRSVVVVGHQRGRTVAEKVRRNFGMPRPEGYRKALRLFHLAERFHRPVITFIDTQGAYPGIDAEERGQAEAIARNIREMAGLRTPIIVVVIGEGGSGGALALGVGDRILMQENACYSVITPEGCAAILYGERTPERVAWAAEALKITAADLLALKVIDAMIPEPCGGAHRHPEEAIALVGEALARHLDELVKLPLDELLTQRYAKFRRMGEAAIVDPTRRMISA